MRLFQNQYEISLNSALPAINCGNHKNPIYLPFEVCKIALNQKVNKLRSEESSNLIRCSNYQEIENRFELIEEKVNTIKEQSSDKLSNLIHLNTKPIEIDGVQLFNPKLNYKNVINFQPNHGKWKMNNKKVLKSNRLDANELCLINLTEKLSSNEIEQFMCRLMTKCNELGIEINQPFNLNKELNKNSFFCEQKDELRIVIDNMIKIYQDKFLKAKPKLILFFIGKFKGDRIYKNIKSESEINYGLNTQCITEQNVHKILDYYNKRSINLFKEEHHVSLKDNGDYILSSFLLKINSKLGGVNCNLTSEQNEISKLKDESIDNWC